MRRQVDSETWDVACAVDPFLRMVSYVVVNPANGIARVMDEAVQCGCCRTIIGAYPPDVPHPDNQLTGRGRWVSLLPIYFNRNDEAYYKAHVSAPERAHTSWHEQPDTSADMLRGLVALIQQHNIAPHATIVPFERFRVKCHACGSINSVEVPS